MRQLFSLSTLTLLSLSLSTTNAGRHPHFSLSNFKTLVTFGDSYTDDSRLGYFINNDGEAPPVGWVQPEVRPPDPIPPNPGIQEDLDPDTM